MVVSLQTANASCAISKSLCDIQRSTNGKTEQIKAIKVNALLFESGKRCSIPAHVPERRDWPRYRSKRGAALEWLYRIAKRRAFRAHGFCCAAYVGLWHKADVPSRLLFVRFRGQSGHQPAIGGQSRIMSTRPSVMGPVMSSLPE